MPAPLKDIKTRSPFAALLGGILDFITRGLVERLLRVLGLRALPPPAPSPARARASPAAAPAAPAAPAARPPWRPVRPARMSASRSSRPPIPPTPPPRQRHRGRSRGRVRASLPRPKASAPVYVLRARRAAGVAPRARAKVQLSSNAIKNLRGDAADPPSPWPSRRLSPSRRPRPSRRLCPSRRRRRRRRRHRPGPAPAPPAPPSATTDDSGDAEAEPAGDDSPTSAAAKKKKQAKKKKKPTAADSEPAAPEAVDFPEVKAAASDSPAEPTNGHSSPNGNGVANGKGATNGKSTNGAKAAKTTAVPPSATPATFLTCEEVEAAHDTSADPVRSAARGADRHPGSRVIDPPPSLARDQAAAAKKAKAKAKKARQAANKRAEKEVSHRFRCPLSARREDSPTCAPLCVPGVGMRTRRACMSLCDIYPPGFAARAPARRPNVRTRVARGAACARDTGGNPPGRLRSCARSAHRPGS